MKHLKPLNSKARRIEEMLSPVTPVEVTAAKMIGAGASQEEEVADVVALQQAPPPHVPMGCTLSFSPGWEVDGGGGTAGLCQPAERDIYDCYVTCFWPVQVPDHVNNSPDWASNCAAATKDWRKLDIIFP